jgi:hypothetical protein
MQGSFIRTATLATVFALAGSFVNAAVAQTGPSAVAPSTGLGESWPNATDVSTSPHWHVYVFVLNGIKYVQVNDLNGNVRAAAAIANGTVLALPIGSDVANVRTGSLKPAMSRSARSSGAETVYRDNTTTVTTVPQRNGGATIYFEDICTNPYSCSAGGS